MSVNTKSQVTTAAAIGESFFQLFQLNLSHRRAFQAPFSERKLLLFSIDTFGIFVATFAAFILMNFAQFEATGYSLAEMELPWLYACTVFLGWLLLATLNDLYDVPSSHDLRLTMQRVLTIGLLGWGVHYILEIIFPSIPGGLEFLLLLGIFLPFVLLWRTLYMSLSNTFLPFQHRVLIIGTSQRGNAIAKVLRDATYLHYHVLGFVKHSESGEPADAVIPSTILGETRDLVQLVQDYRAHQIVLATDQPIERELFTELMACQGNGVAVAWMPDLYEKLCHKVPVEHIDPSWGLYAMQDRPIFQRLQLGIKRALDLLLCCFAWPMFLVVLPLLALAIYLDSPGPIFYRQTRSGRGGKPFSIYKFRTMRTDAEADGKARWASKTDSRITRVGKFLRKSRLDELPQIINVLRGEMSFIGPRPERPEFVEVLEKEIPLYRTRLMVKPGLTGWAQVHYDYGNSMEDALIKLQYDFYYVRYWSFWLDLYILFRTIGVVVKLKGT